MLSPNICSSDTEVSLSFSTALELIPAVWFRKPQRKEAFTRLLEDVDRQSSLVYPAFHMFISTMRFLLWKLRNNSDWTWIAECTALSEFLCQSRQLDIVQLHWRLMESIFTEDRKMGFLWRGTRGPRDLGNFLGELILHLPLCLHHFLPFLTWESISFPASLFPLTLANSLAAS